MSTIGNHTEFLAPLIGMGSWLAQQLRENRFLPSKQGEVQSQPATKHFTAVGSSAGALDSEQVSQEDEFYPDLREAIRQSLLVSSNETLTFTREINEPLALAREVSEDDEHFNL